MFSQERVRGFRVIEFRAQRLHRDLFPSTRLVARLARPRHGAAVRIGVAGTAPIKFHPRVLRFSIRSRQVTFLAGDLGVQSGQRIARARMIEMPRPHRNGFPVIKVVALQAILSETSIVKIFVTGHACLRNPQEGLAQILLLYVRALGGGDFIGQVALIAGQAGMFAFQQVSGFFVIELVRIPLDQRKIFAVVIRVAAHAFLAGARGDVIGPVQSALGGDSRANIGVTADALELRLAAPDFVAIGAVQGPVQKLVLPRERAGRNLRPARSNQPIKNCKLQKEE